MRPSIKVLTGIAAALAALAMALPFAPAAGAETQRGCPSESFCIYAQDAYWNDNHPSYIMHPDWAHYDDHQIWNLKNQVGIHKVFLNATPGGGIWMSVWLNRGYNGAGPVLRGIAAGRSYDLDLTKVNSVTVWWAQMTNNY